MNILLPTAEELATALNKAEFVKSFNRALSDAGGAGDFDSYQHITLNELAERLAHNGVRFGHGCAVVGEDSDVENCLRTLKQAAPYLKPLP